MSPADHKSNAQSDTNTAQAGVNMAPAQANIGTTGNDLNTLHTKPRPEMPVIEDLDLHFVYKDKQLLYNGYTRLPTEKIQELIEENSETNLPRELIEAQMKLYGEHAPWSPFRQVLFNQMRNYVDIGGCRKIAAHVQKVEKELSARYKSAMEKYERELAAWEAEQRAAQDVPMEDN
ncbi:hypothetical protein V8F33_010052 [Rhypophila sp. PSN 637]